VIAWIMVSGKANQLVTLTARRILHCQVSMTLWRSPSGMSCMTV